MSVMLCEPRVDAQRDRRPSGAPLARLVAKLAVRSLHAELMLYPKPGLVSGHDNGAHTDMDGATLMRGLASLRHYFAAVAVAGARRASMHELRRFGIAAESRMLAATRGINTHRGAIFALGLMAASIGRLHALGWRMSACNVRAALTTWRTELSLVEVTGAHSTSHGTWVAQHYGASGARGEARAGYPAVFDRALPALQHALANGADAGSARVHALFVLLASVADSNVLYRGGRGPSDRLQSDAAEFLAAGSVFTDGWIARAEALHRYCCEAGVSPGGCADLLAATIFLHEAQTHLQ
jgi:triphosphoribosyl-dephospho-CoA synthase